MRGLFVLTLRGIWFRRTASIAAFVVAIVATAAATLGPLYARSAEDSLVREQLKDAPAESTTFALTTSSAEQPNANVDQLRTGLTNAAGHHRPRSVVRAGRHPDVHLGDPGPAGQGDRRLRQPHVARRPRVQGRRDHRWCLPGGRPRGHGVDGDRQGPSPPGRLQAAPAVRRPPNGRARHRRRDVRLRGADAADVGPGRSPRKLRPRRSRAPTRRTSTRS